MRTPISRQPKGIPVGGQFAATMHGEPGLRLGAPGPAAVNEDDVLTAVTESMGPGAVPGVRRRLAETQTDGGRQLFLQRCDALYNQESAYTVDRSIHGPDPEQCDALAALGYESVNDFSPEKLKNFRGVDSIIAGGIEPGRLELLTRLTRHEFQWSAWEKEAYLGAGLEDLETVISNQDASLRDRYVATVALLGPEKAERVRHALELGIGDRGLIEADTHPLETVAELRAALPSSKRGAWHIVQLADKGITGAHLRTYGTKACEQYTARQLEASPVPPKTIRSFLAAGVRVDLDGMKLLHEAGYTAGADLKSASQAMGTYDPERLAAARGHASGDELARFGAALSSRVSVEDAEAIAVLRAHGITEPAQLRPYTTAAHSRANHAVNRNQSVLAVHANVIKAGISPEKLGQMQRAGIPVDEAPAFKDSADLWADGKKYRDAHDADQARKLEGRWIRTASPWAFTEENYLKGTEQ